MGVSPRPGAAEAQLQVSLLLDTNIVIRWLIEPKKLSREQVRALEQAVRRRETISVCAITLIEIATLFTDGPVRIKTTTAEALFEELGRNPTFQILPLSFEIAEEVLKMSRALRDPVDRVIVATARVHGLHLVTSDQRIIESNLVQTVG